MAYLQGAQLMGKAEKQFSNTPTCILMHCHRAGKGKIFSKEVGLHHGVL